MEQLKQRGRGRPDGPFTAALRSVSLERMALLTDIAQRINGDVIQTAAAATAEANKTRREILQHNQPKGAVMANEDRNRERMNRLVRLRKALENPKLAQLTASSAAMHLSTELGLSPHTLRKDIAELRKLTGPTS